MDSTPRDIIINIALNLEPRELLRLCKTNKKYSNICKSDIFWKKYYDLYVDKENEVEPHLKIDGNWMKAFMHNYNYKKVIDFSLIDNDDLFYIRDHTKKDNTGIYNYLAMFRKGNIITYAPILVEESFSKTRPQFLLDFNMSSYNRNGKWITSTRLDKITYNKYGKMVILPDDYTPIDVKTWEVIVYPYRNPIRLDIDKISRLKYGVPSYDYIHNRRILYYQSFTLDGEKYDLEFATSSLVFPSDRLFSPLNEKITDLLGIERL